MSKINKIRSQIIKSFLMVLILGSLFSIASATQNTKVTLEGRLTNTTNGTGISGANLTVAIFNNNTCSGTPLFNETFLGITDINGYYTLLLGNSTPLSLDYNTDYFACLWKDSTFLAGAVQFVGGHGEIKENSVNFTNLNVGGDVTADYFIGDGSQLTNLSVNATTINHNSLNNLNWSVAGHIMDDDMVFDAGKGVFFDNGATNGMIYNLSAGGQMQWVGGEIHFVNTYLNLDDGYGVYFGDNGEFSINYDNDPNVNMTLFYDYNQRPAWFVNGITLGDAETLYDGTIYWDGKNLSVWEKYNFTSNQFEFNKNISAPYFKGDGSQLTGLPIGATYWNRSGTTIFQANFGDDVTLQNGSIYLDKNYYIDWDSTVNEKRLTYNNTTSRFEFGSELYAPQSVFGNSTGNTTITPTGTTLYGTARVNKTIQNYAYNVYGLAGTYNGNTYVASALSSLDGNLFQELVATVTGGDVGSAFVYNFIMPQDRVTGSNFTIVLHYMPSTTDTTNVLVGIGEGHTADGESYSQTETYNEQTFAIPTTQYFKGSHEFNFDGSTIENGNAVKLIIYRNSEAGADTYGGILYVNSLEIKYLSDKI